MSFGRHGHQFPRHSSARKGSLRGEPKRHFLKRRASRPIVFSDPGIASACREVGVLGLDEEGYRLKVEDGDRVDGILRLQLFKNGM